MKKKKLLSVLVVAALGCSLFSAVPIVSQAANTTGVTMYRLYNPNSGEHFYTKNASEKSNLVAVGWNDEGIGWIAPETSNTPVYRLYNPNSGDHHYTVNAEERDNLISVGWNDEGIGCYSDDNKTVPLYRGFNPYETVGTHIFTTSKEEHGTLVSMGWVDEGIGWYGCNDKTPADLQEDFDKALSSVKIDITSPQVGDNISAIITPSDAKGVTYKWEALDTADAQSGDNIGSGEKVQLTDDYAGKYIRVTATDPYGNSFSDSTSAPVEKLEPEPSPIVITFPDLPIDLTNVSQSGLAQLTSFTYEVLDGDGADDSYTVKVHYEGTILHADDTIYDHIVLYYFLWMDEQVCIRTGEKRTWAFNDDTPFSGDFYLRSLSEGEYFISVSTEGEG